ncbi:MAG TPA: DUF4062 domain-containing protein [Pyrinomonadaceae bacterium]|jgi:hypothetical protein|nr:DUF4062 domain-containing protein [Pyrinomonadaceae bacterium]
MTDTDERLRVFVSYTSSLKEEPGILREKISTDFFNPFFYDSSSLPAGNKKPAEHCLEMIEKSQAFLGLLGAEYGSLFPPPDGEVSACEWEFKAASDPARAIEIRMFECVPPEKITDPKQKVFVDSVRALRWCRPFDTVDVINWLYAWRDAYFKRRAQEQAHVLRWLHRHLLPLAVGAALLVGASVLTALILSVSQALLLTILGVECLVIVLCIILLLSQMGGPDERDD